MLTVCTKNFYFAFDTHVQRVGVRMRSPPAPFLVGIFIVKLETAVTPMLSLHVMFWKCYVIDTICFVQNGFQDYNSSSRNNFTI